MFIDYFLTLQQKFNHLVTFILNVLKIKYIIMLQVYDIIKISCIITEYDIIIKKNSITLIIKKAHFRLHALKLSLNAFQSIILSCAKRKWDWERIKKNLFIFNLLSFKMFIRVLKILSIVLFQYAHLNAVDSDENFEDFSNFTWR